MGRAQAEANARRRGVIPETIEPEKKQPEASLPEPETNLDDPAVQESILNPESVVVKLSYGDLRLHQPSVAMRRRIFGYVTRVFTDAASVTGVTSKELLSSRIASLLCSREDLEEQLFETCAKLMDKPGKISDERAVGLAKEISEQASPDDITVLYGQLCVLAKLNQAAAVPPPQRRRKR